MSLEDQIAALTAALIAATAAYQGSDATPSVEPAKRGRKPKSETESAAPSQTVVQPVTTAPVTAQAQQTTAPPTQPASANPQLLAQTTEAVLKLANEYSREQAVGLLASYKVTRCSDLLVTQLQEVLTKATTAINVAEAAKQGAKANDSLV